MDGIGLQTSLDGVANVRGRLHGKHPDQPAWLMGSHYDTVVDGGFFDGALGIIAGHRCRQGSSPGGDDDALSPLASSKQTCRS